MYEKLAIGYFLAPEKLYPVVKTRLQPIRARSVFHKSSDNPNVSPANVDFSL